MTIKILFYGKLANIIGRETEVPLDPPCTIAALRRLLVTMHPDAAESLSDRRVRALVGNEFVSDDHRVAPHDEVEFLSPVSGG
jgi:molybdopterin converting factor small subunit